MNKLQFAGEIAELLEVPKNVALGYVNAFETVVTAQLCKGEPVMISGFVKFARVDRPARMGRNPATGEQIRIKAKRAVKVTPLKKLKDTVLASKGTRR